MANQDLPSVLFRPTAWVHMHIHDDHSSSRVSSTFPPVTAQT